MRVSSDENSSVPRWALGLSVPSGKVDGSNNITTGSGVTNSRRAASSEKRRNCEVTSVERYKSLVRLSSLRPRNRNIDYPEERSTEEEGRKKTVQTTEKRRSSLKCPLRKVVYRSDTFDRSELPVPPNARDAIKRETSFFRNARLLDSFQRQILNCCAAILQQLSIPGLANQITRWFSAES